MRHCCPVAMPARSRCCVSREGAPLRATRQPFPLAFGCLKKLLFRVLFLNHPSVKHACGAPKTVRPWRNKPSNLIFAPNPPRATPIRLASPKLEAFAVDNTAKPAFREALVSFIRRFRWCMSIFLFFSSGVSHLSRDNRVGRGPRAHSPQPLLAPPAGPSQRRT